MIRQYLARISRTWEFKLVIGGALVSSAQLLLTGSVPLPGGRGNLLLLEWTLTAIVGCGYSTWFVRDTLYDLRAQGASGRNGNNEIAALVLILAASLLLIVHLLFLELGLPALLSPPVPVNMGTLIREVQITLVGQFLLWGLSLIHRFRNKLIVADV